MSIKCFLANLLSKKKENEGSGVCNLPSPHFKHYTRDELLDLLDLNVTPSIPQVDTGKKKLLIVDDISETWYILKTTANEIMRRHGVNFYDDFDVTFITTELCGLLTYKHLLTKGLMYDYAMVDLSIGTRINIKDADILELDGIDLVDLLIKYIPDIKTTFFTAHTLSKDDKRMRRYFEKCDKLLHKDLETVSISKSEDRIEQIYKFLYRSA